MKDFPRIHALSTIGLRQHQGFDYDFHPFRTDFFGDSGCGKSMIADLLQLVFVGNNAFRSPTPSSEKREPKGMVLPVSQRSGTGIGHAFLHVEVAAGAYLAIGIHLRETDNTVDHFIIQSGYDADDPQPFRQRLRVADFIQNGLVPSPGDFATIITARDLVYKPLSLKKFHRWLYEHDLLTMDLNAGRTLKDYATIIQAFSRGNSLDLNKSDSLKDFLFGSEKAEEMLKKFNSAVDAIKDATVEYGRHQREIDDVTRKWTAIHQLGVKKEEYEEARRVCAVAECAYAFQQEEVRKQRLEELAREIHDGLHNLKAYDLNISKWLETAPNTATALQQRSTAAVAAFGEANTEHEILKKARKALGQLQQDPATLREHYQLNRIGLEHRNHFVNLRQALTEGAVYMQFERLAKKANDFAELMQMLDGQLEINSIALENQNALLAFASIDSKGTFGSWAINDHKVLSREAESVLMYFKEYPLIRPTILEDESRVIVDPAALLHNLEWEPDITADGFWLLLGSLEEFIPYAPERLFSEEGVKTLSSQLAELAQVSEQEINRLQTEVNNLTSLRDTLLNLSGGGPAALQAYRYFEIDENPQPEKALAIPENEFQQYLDALQNEAAIGEKFTAAEAAMDLASAEKTRFETRFETMATHQETISRILVQNKWTDALRTIIEKVIPDDYHSDIPAICKQTAAEASHIEHIEEFYRERIDAAKLTQRHLETEKAYQEYQSAVAIRTEKATEHEKIFGAPYTPTRYTGHHLPDPDQERQQHTTAHSKYEAQFQHIVSSYVTDQYCFALEQDYDELCETVLPHILGKSRPVGLSNIEAFKKYSDGINEKNRRFNNRKLQAIKSLLDDVESEVRARQSEVGAIDRFLNDSKREITGGYRARLTYTASQRYPLRWMEEYVNRMPTDGGLFDVVDDAAKRLIEAGTSLEDKMKEAFRQLSGNRVDTPTIAELLDPNTYFNLSFSMQSQSHEKNKGSTGQTYTALALLCIARLSRVAQGVRTDKSPGLRFMPIDEAEGLGTNYDMLHRVAKENDYQIISMSIGPLGIATGEGRNLYGLHRNLESGEDINRIPLAIFEKDNHAASSPTE